MTLNLQEIALDTKPSKKPDSELSEHLTKRVHWKTVGLLLLTGLCAVVVVVWFGRHGAHEIKAMEAWIAGHGVWGWVVFVGMMVVLTSVFVPDTILTIAAGAMFGVGLGTLLTVIAATITAALNYLVARWLLQKRIKTMLDQHPKFRAISRAAKSEGLRLLLLLRLAPISPVLVSYVLGATGVRFSKFMIAMVGIIPAMFVGVYFGSVASHVTKVAGNASEHSPLQTTITIVGFVVCVVLVISITRVATKALADAELESTPTKAQSDQV